MTSIFTVMDDSASSFRSVSIIDAHPCTDDLMEVNDFLVAALPLPSTRAPLDEQLDRQMKHAFPGDVVLVPGDMLALTTRMDLGGKAVHLAKTIIP